MSDGYVSARAIEVVRGADHKLYGARQLTREERSRARWLAHNLHCRDRLSTREVQRVMAESYGVRRSIGAICNDLANFECPACADQAPEPTPESQQQPSAAVHSQPGFLTGMLRDDG